MKAIPYISIIVPVYNESARLRNIFKITDYLKKTPYKSELIFVNDGSSDNTLDILRKNSNELNFEIISYKKNKGKGYAVRAGMLAAKGKYRMFTDIDLSVPIEEFDKFIKAVQEKSIVIGSRRKISSKILRHQPRVREWMGRFFTWLSQNILCLNISDFTCGFKCFEKDAAIDIFSKTKINRWVFDGEILFLAKKFGHEIGEIPVSWRNDPYTRVRFPKDAIISLIELLEIRLIDIFSLY